MGCPRLLVLALIVAVAPLARASDVDYVRDVKPLLKQHCYSCHGALKQEAKLRVDTAELLRKGGETGPAIHVGKSLMESPFVRRITSTDPAVRMPQESKPLTPEQIAILQAWVEQGYFISREFGRLCLIP